MASADRLALCWGANFFGELGLGSVVQNWYTTPTPSVDPSKVWSTVATGSDHTSAVAGGGLYCFGSNLSGELATARGMRQASLFRIPSRPGLGATLTGSTIAADDYATCGIRSAGLLFCWGNGAAGDGIGYWAYTVPTPAQFDRWTSVSMGVLRKIALRYLGP